MESLSSRSDIIGSVASGLCVVHCAATPLLFVAQTCAATGCCEAGPSWWSAIDYLFIVITFLAVYYSGKHTGKIWMRIALYTSWTVLTLIILNEKAAWLAIPEFWKYLSAAALIGLHLFNKRFCQCHDDRCLVPV